MIKAKILKTKVLRKKKTHIYETYKNTVTPHGNHFYAKASDMENAKMCAYQRLEHSLPHWKCVLICFGECASINLPDKETDDQYSNTSPSNF